ncbi:MAG: superoxide dismutase family protein [Novosphingobium sp.]|nr:superoxide dismutase family protein [Novosphingobium sp.]MCP5403255.1 superoxide dismutase family protein [Novosphingobium sp.]
MTRLVAALLLTAGGLLSSCTTVSEPADSTLAGATLLSGDGSGRGTATLSATGDTVTLTVDANGLPAGQHGTHLHAVGNCTRPDFKSAGGHLNPAGRQHGLENPAGSHLGDLPNLSIDDSGSGTLTIRLEGSWAELEPALFDDDGTAVVIHADPDDYRTDPSGNAGPRLACGIVTRN